MNYRDEKKRGHLCLFMHITDIVSVFEKRRAFVLKEGEIKKDSSSTSTGLRVVVHATPCSVAQYC